MKQSLIRLVIVFLIISFTVSSVIGCCGRWRRKTRRLERRNERLEKRVDDLEKKR